MFQFRDKINFSPTQVDSLNYIRFLNTPDAEIQQFVDQNVTLVDGSLSPKKELQMSDDTLLPQIFRQGKDFLEQLKTKTTLEEKAVS